MNHALDLVKGGWRYAGGLGRFLSATTDIDEAKIIFLRQLHSREESFLAVLQHGIYDNPKSPYRRLLRHAGFDLADVRALVQSVGLESALSELHDAGVYVTLDEFKGRLPIRRLGLEFEASASDFDNPHLTAHYEGRSGGSRGGGTRVPLDFDFTAYEAVDFLIGLNANGVTERPAIVWSSGPPAALGLKWVFLLLRSGRTADRWFSPTTLLWNRQGIQARFLLVYTDLVGRLMGRRIPAPKHAPDAKAAALFLAESTQNGRPALAFCVPSQFVRVCNAAAEAGLDLAGTVFWGGGEPYTTDKAAAVSESGCRAVIGYAMSEAGYITHGCGNPSAPDDMHILKDKFAVLTRSRDLAPGFVVQALYHTSLLTSAPKLMLNVESGDYGEIDERQCGCLWQDLGLTTHLHHVRSYEKLTSEGVTFMGSMLHELLERVLPQRFGGGPLDYQLVEEEEAGIPRVTIVVSPGVGAVNESAVIDAVLEQMSFADWSRRQAVSWRQNQTLRVRRQEPFSTTAGKILPLHVLSTTRTGDTMGR
jgi:hypothetical protein